MLSLKWVGAPLDNTNDEVVVEYTAATAGGQNIKGNQVQYSVPMCPKPLVSICFHKVDSIC